jgi:hypothetical protein
MRTSLSKSVAIRALQIAIADSGRINPRGEKPGKNEEQLQRKFVLLCAKCFCWHSGDATSPIAP